MRNIKRSIRQLSKKLVSLREVIAGFLEKSGKKYHILAAIGFMAVPVLDWVLFRPADLISKIPIFSNYFIPFNIRAVLVFLRLGGVEATASSVGVLAQEGSLILPQIFIKFLGWQILIVTGFVLLAWKFGKQYSLASKLKALAAGVLGSYLINILGLSLVILARVKAGQMISETIFYFSNLTLLVFFGGFKRISRTFFLEGKSEGGKSQVSFDGADLRLKRSSFNNFSNKVSPLLLNNQSNSFIPKKRLSWVARFVLVLLTIISTTLFYYSRGIPVVEATNMAGPLKLDIGSPDNTPPSYANWLDDSQSYASSSSLWPVGNQYANRSRNNYWWMTNLLPTGTFGPNAVIPGGNYYVQFAKQGNGTVGGTNTANYYIQLYLTSSNGATRTILQSNTFMMRQNNTSNVLLQYSIGNLVGNNITTTARNRLGVWLMYINGNTTSCQTNANCYWNIAINNTNLPARLIIPAAGITVPEIPKPMIFAILIIVMPVMPTLVAGRYRKKGRGVFEEFGLAWQDLVKRLLGLEDKVLDELPV